VGEGYTAQPYSMAAVNNSCKNKKLAFEFIKTLLSKDIQKTKNVVFIPVNVQSVNEMLSECKGEKGTGEIIRGAAVTDSIATVGLSDILIEDYRHIISNISKCTIPDNNVLTFIDEMSQDFFKDKSTADKTIKDIENKVNLYLNE
jgi:ABC-type glycerol-3-phosphate transport system substrate-binding protein